MARGLSELQNTLLRLAYRNRQREQEPGAYRWLYPHPAPDQDLYPYEALEICWGWTPYGSHYEHALWCRRRWRCGGSRAQAAWGKLYSREQIGPAEYDAAHVSLSRALRRLQARGLMVARWDGSAGFGGGRAFNLTAVGLILAAQLEVEAVSPLPEHRLTADDAACRAAAFGADPAAARISPEEKASAAALFASMGHKRM